MKIARVALDVPVATTFDYLAADAGVDDVGRLAIVPLGKRMVVGVILEFATRSTVPFDRLKDVLRVVRDVPALGARDLRLLKFAAGYYHHGLGSVVLGSLPARLRRIRALEPATAHWALTAAGEVAAAATAPARAPVRLRLLALFKERRSLDISVIKTVAPSAPSVLKDLVARGWVAPGKRVQPSGPATKQHAAEDAPPLTREQTDASHAICARLDRFVPFLLLGVTGSGKTEVYLHAMDAVLRAGRQALLLVPEIALTPQLEAVVRTRFPLACITTLHSGLSEAERLEHWLAARAGRARIVLGTRLAVFAPLPELGIIIVDEEHDASLKQMEGLRYSARDLAVVRARQCGIPILLGSATPALESYRNAIAGRYHLLTLSRRINAAPPLIACINTRGDRTTDGLSPRLLDAMAARLTCNEQSMVFINRRGFAPVLMCHGCGWLSGCRRCSAQLVLHLRDRSLRCHHCGHQAPVPVVCPGCGSHDLAPLGHGTQRIEAALMQHFPHARILRIDRDSTRRKLAWPEMRRRIHEREVDILVGTQILAKGHDFPHLNLVGVVNADSLLYSTDFRASERLFALLTQVAGRAGRGETQGEVLIQTDFPDHPLYTALRSQDYAVFARHLLDERRQAGLPPFMHQALLRAEASRLETALAFLARAARIGKSLGHRVTIYDPVPAAMVRLAGRERAQLLVQAESRSRLQEFLAAWHDKLVAERLSRARWSLDVDPLAF
ncbi:MAG: primosomal protein N' [Betaproteobacteria bacterium]|nr:primosomal protein N' [Betaproteobacteria bacterium]